MPGRRGDQSKNARPENAAETGPGKWVSIASIVVPGVGTLAVVIALVYSSAQVRTLQDKLDFDRMQAQHSLVVLRAGNDLKLMGHTMALDRLFIDRPELRPYIYGDQEVPGEGPMRARVMSTAELIVDLADSVASMMRHGQLDCADRHAWGKALEAYGRSPAVEQIVEEDDSGGAWRESTLSLLRDETKGPAAPVEEVRVREPSC